VLLQPVPAASMTVAIAMPAGSTNAVRVERGR
jgi:hypothetical protein